MWRNPVLILIFAMGIVTGYPIRNAWTDGELVLSPKGQADSKDNTYASESLVFKGSGWDQKNNAPAEVQSSIRLRAGAGPVTPIAHGDMKSKTWPANHALDILDGDQKPWVTFSPIHKEMWLFKDESAGTGVPFNLVNRDYGDLAIRFIKGQQPNPWIINIPAEEKISQFAILRDWLFTAVMWDEDGRTLMGRLEPHPPNNAPTKARLNVRGHKDELQFLIEADRNQTHPIAQIGNHGNDQSYITVGSEGNLGLGGELKPLNVLTVCQNSQTDPIADAWTVYSSRRWKRDIQPIEAPLEKVRRLEGIRFRSKATGKKDIGFIAEDVAEVLPEIVTFDENGQEACAMDYSRLVPLLVEVVKKQQKQIEQLRTDLNSFKDEQGSLK